MENLARETTRLAALATAKYLGEHFPGVAPRPPAAAPAPRAGTRPRAANSAPVVALRDVQVRAFDLDSDNNPEIVLTAQWPLPAGAATNAANIYVTLVARQEAGTDWHTLFSYVTDDTRLDIDPQLEFLDAVDADGDGIAELLFRTYATSLAGGTPGYRLYQPYGDRLRLVYDSRGEQ